MQRYEAIVEQIDSLPEEQTFSLTTGQTRLLRVVGTIKGAEGEAVVKWLQKIEKASTKDWTAAAWKLERRYPKQFGKHLQIEDESITPPTGFILIDATEDNHPDE